MKSKTINLEEGINDFTDLYLKVLDGECEVRGDRKVKVKGESKGKVKVRAECVCCWDLLQTGCQANTL